MKKKIAIKGKLLFHRFWLLLFFSASAFSCEGKDDISQPSNLNLTLTIQGADANNPNGDGSGIITCVATAENAVRYAYQFEGRDKQESPDGTISYTFLKQGTNTFSILVFAYSSSGEFINVTQSLRIFVSKKEEPTLVFSDEFNVDGAPDPANWNYDLGNGDNGWGNSESQFYTDRTDNVNIADGILTITAKKESLSGFEYTSTRMKTQGLREFTYGRIDIRAKLPEGGGTWPGIWMLGSNITTVGWPACGEIDIMEHVGNNQGVVQSAIHNNSSFAATVNKGDITVADASSEFHVYSMNWSPDQISFLVDEEVYYTYNPSTKNADTWPFDADQFIILNVAMGGSFGGSIDPSFVESTMEVDYVRYYQ